MSEFDSKAREWDDNPDHWERSEAITAQFIKLVQPTPGMNAMEFGAGTGLMSFLLAKHFSGITLMDNSREMVNVMKEKIATSGYTHFKPLFFDLEKNDYHDEKFDCIYSQMALHHVADLTGIINRFYKLLNPAGYLAIADLYTEDGSFHGESFTGHHGFDALELQKLLEKAGFNQVETQTCYLLKRMVEETKREFPIFLMVARKSAR
jgi:ubiquinone/menaquinone biosynthesis C-methylase UbiE